ncbi:MAG: N-acyl homoserine lactonase family protein, partial [Xanthomonadales bacterium]|nr:N-acyl homoserine lactonase family protein [Xanthomonadales bacterium]
PEAEFIIQDDEVHFATGRYMRYKAARQAFEADDVTQLIRANYKGRVRFV